MESSKLSVGDKVLYARPHPSLPNQPDPRRIYLVTAIWGDEVMVEMHHNPIQAHRLDPYYPQVDQ